MRALTQRFDPGLCHLLTPASNPSLQSSENCDLELTPRALVIGSFFAIINAGAHTACCHYSCQNRLFG